MTFIIGESYEICGINRLLDETKFMGIKRLYFDIEVSPCIGFFWNPGHKINISYENIIKERAIICICYKWEHEKKVSSLTWDSKQDDKKMLQEFIKIADTADEMVGHNGDKFDLSWIRTRCLFHRIPMFPDYVSTDTLKVARAKFRFNSNRLNYIGQFLGLGQKIHTGFDLWKNIVTNKCEKSLDKMVRYCKQDVKLLEGVYLVMKNHIKPKTHQGVKMGKEKVSCPECGGNTRISKTVFNASGLKRFYRQCTKCWKNHTTSK